MMSSHGRGTERILRSMCQTRQDGCAMSFSRAAVQASFGQFSSMVIDPFSMHMPRGMAHCVSHGPPVSSVFARKVELSTWRNNPHAYCQRLEFGGTPRLAMTVAPRCDQTDTDGSAFVQPVMLRSCVSPADQRSCTLEYCKTKVQR